MPEIIYSNAEKAKIDRLVDKYSPINQSMISPDLQRLQQESRREFVREFETVLRAVAETALIVLARLRIVSDELHVATAPDVILGAKTVLNEMSSIMLNRGQVDGVLGRLAGQGDSQLTKRCYRLPIDLIDEILIEFTPLEG